MRRLAEASGIETPTRAELARFDRSRKNRTTSNEAWQSPQDPGREDREDEGRSDALGPQGRGRSRPGAGRHRRGDRAGCVGGRFGDAAGAAKMPNTRRPAAVVVSICAPWPASTRRPTPRADKSLHGVDEMGEVAAQAVELPDDEHVALPQGAQAAVEFRPVVAYAGGEVVVQVDCVDALGPQGVALQVQRLGAVRLRDAGITVQSTSRPSRPRAGCRRRRQHGTEAA